MGILSFCYFRMSNLIKLMSANRILISSNTISYIVDNIFISFHIEMLFDVANIRVISWKHHPQCSILQLCLLPILILSQLGEIAPNGEDKEKINAKVSELRSKGIFSILKDSIWALLSPVIVLGCIYAGIASPTEAAVISVFYALFVSLFIYKSIKVKEIWGIMVEAMKTYAPILFILAASTAFSRVLTLMQVPQTVSAWILAHFTNEIVLLIVINVFLLIVGMVMDTTPAILILSPILLPIVQSIGMNPIHFGVVMIVNLAIGFVTPPIGVNLFVASSLTDVPVMRIAKKAAPMIGYFLLALLILTFVPAISLFLL